MTMMLPPNPSSFIYDLTLTILHKIPTWKFYFNAMLRFNWFRNKEDQLIFHQSYLLAMLGQNYLNLKPH